MCSVYSKLCTLPSLPCIHMYIVSRFLCYCKVYNVLLTKT